MNAKQVGISRRTFIGSSALLLGSALAVPKDAFAAPVENDAFFELEGSAEARAIWAEAVRKANQEGLPVYYGSGEGCGVEDCDINDPALRSVGTALWVSVKKRNSSETYNTTVIISAKYGVTTANKISFKEAKIYNSILTVRESDYSRAILDGGRTNMIYFHAVFTTTAGLPTFVGDFVAEFYYTFKGKIY